MGKRACDASRGALVSSFMEDPTAIASQTSARKTRTRALRVRKPTDFSRMHPDQNVTEEDASEFLALSRGTLRNRYDVEGRYYDESFPAPQPTGKGSTAIRYRFGSLVEWNRKNHCLPMTDDAVTQAKGVAMT